LAESLGDIPQALFAHMVLWGREIRETYFDEALVRVEHTSRFARHATNRADVALAEWMLGHTYHHVGRLEESRVHLQAALDQDTEEGRQTLIQSFGYDRRVDGMGILANTLWTLGLADQARTLSEQAVAESRQLPIELGFGVAMTWAGLNRYLYDRDIGAV